MIRAFVDSSAFYSGCLSLRGASHEILQEGMRGHVELVISDVVLDETERNLAAVSVKAAEALARFRVFLGGVPFERVEADEAAVLDAADYTVLKDAPIVAAARQAGVDYLCSLDRRHLVDAPEVAERSGLTIVLPETLLRLIRVERERAGSPERE